MLWLLARDGEILKKSALIMLLPREQEICWCGRSRYLRRKQVIGVVDVYINYETEEYNKYYTHPISVFQLRDCESKNIKRLLLGSIVNLTLNELLDVLSRQNLLNINTLSVQKSGEQFWCRVDELTSNYWHEQKEKMKEEGQI
jgi:hypothetical protein